MTTELDSIGDMTFSSETSLSVHQRKPRLKRESEKQKPARFPCFGCPNVHAGKPCDVVNCNQLNMWLTWEAANR